MVFLCSVCGVMPWESQPMPISENQNRKGLLHPILHQTLKKYQSVLNGLKSFKVGGKVACKKQHKGKKKEKEIINRQKTGLNQKK